MRCSLNNARGYKERVCVVQWNHFEQFQFKRGAKKKLLVCSCLWKRRKKREEKKKLIHVHFQSRRFFLLIYKVANKTFVYLYLCARERIMLLKKSFLIKLCVNRQQTHEWERGGVMRKHWFKLKEIASMKAKSIFAFYYKLLAYKRGSYDDWWVMCSTSRQSSGEK